MLWLVPIDAVNVKVSLPVDSKIDRFAIAGMVLLWMLFGGDRRPRGRRPIAFLAAVGVFVGVAFASLAFNLPRVIRLGELDLAQKQLALLVAFGLFAWFAVVAMRPSELRAFSRLTIGLGTLCAVGVIVERKTGYNAFYEVSRAILSPIATVAASPTLIHPDPLRVDRPIIVGPTEHGLAVTTMLSMALSFAVVALLDARTWGRRAAYGLCVALMLAGALSTERKTGVVVPVVVLAALLVYRTRDLLRLWPLVFVLAIFIHVASPGALGTVSSLQGFLNTDSTEGRTSDYAAIMPDVVTHPVLGFGYGSLDIAKADTYRILDNEYLGQLLQSGLIGVAAYLAMALAAVAVARPAARSRDRARASPAAAGLAAAVGFAVASALFDILSFPQPVYLFLFAGAVCTVAATGLRREAVAPIAEPRTAGRECAAPMGPLPAMAAGRLSVPTGGRSSRWAEPPG
jgi:O-antigen ligase